MPDATLLPQDKTVVKSALRNCQTCQIVWEEELHTELRYQQDRPFFHSYASELCSVGFSFADETEASAFFSKVNQRTQLPIQGPQSPISPKASSPSKAPPSPSAATPVESTPVRQASGKKERKKFDKSQIGTPSNFRHLTHIGWDPEKGFSTINIPPEWKKVFEQAGVTEDQLQDQNTAKFIFDFMASHQSPPPPPTSSHAATSDSAPTVARASAPPPPPPATTNNRRAPPPPPASRVTQGNVGANGSRSAPPPPPPFSRGNDAPPPPPSRAAENTPSTDRHLSPPPPPPPSRSAFGFSLPNLFTVPLGNSESSAPPPPPPPPPPFPSNSAYASSQPPSSLPSKAAARSLPPPPQDTRANLMASIRGGTSMLKSVNEREAPPPLSAEPAENNIAASLKMALQSRQHAMAGSGVKSDDEQDDEDW